MKHTFLSSTDNVLRRRKELARHVGREFRNIRLSKNLTQSEVARRTFLHPSTINYIEGGRNLPSLSSLLDLCWFYKVSPNHILKGVVKFA